MITLSMYSYIFWFFCLVGFFVFFMELFKLGRNILLVHVFNKQLPLTTHEMDRDWETRIYSYTY